GRAARQAGRPPYPENASPPSRACAREASLAKFACCGNLPEMSRTVAIVGRPNVGKSALFNRLAGRKIAIVHDQPGVTRDRISSICERGLHPFTVWDTGGIFGGGETELTNQVRGAVDEALRQSDLVLFVVDGKD